MITVTENKELNGIEVMFSAKPARAIIDALKAAGFRWHRIKKIWYAKSTPERMALADDIKNGKPVKAAAPAKANTYGVKLGDLFSMSWGYDQTQVDFFQVIKLCGASSVRVRQVYPQIISESPTCSMAADYTYQLTNELLPAAQDSIFIHDQEKGDLKRLHDNATPYITFDVGIASKCSGDTATEYVSWYA